MHRGIGDYRDMAVTYDITSKSAFVLRPEAVERVWRILESTYGSVEATARCADNARREFGTLAQLLVFDNAKAKEILSLELSARSDGYLRHGEITFGDLGDPISIRLSASEDDEILRVHERLRDVIDGVRAWYSPISRIDVAGGLFFSLPVLWLVARVTAGDPTEPRRAVELGQAALLAALLIAFVGALCFVGWLIWRLHSRFFPRAFFALGRSARLSL